jgi:hypothetical protein
VTLRTARCHCGAVTLACEGEPRKVSMCHCRDCQRRTGSPFGVAVFYPRQRVRIGGGTHGFTRDSASGSPVTFRFCPACGTNLFWEPARLPDLIGVAIGAFADPDFPPPEQSVWTEEKHRWLALPEGMPVHDRNPPPRG